MMNLTHNPAAMNDDALCKTAKSLIDQGETAQAIQILTGLVQNQTRYWKAYNDLGCLLYEQGNLLDAITLLRVAVDMESAGTTALRNLAAVHATRGDIGKTLAACTLIAQRTPEDHEIPLFVMDVLKQTQLSLDSYGWLGPEVANMEKIAHHYLKMQEQEEAANNTTPDQMYKICSRLSDDEWQRVLLGSINQPIFQGIRLPGFPAEQLQAGTVGSAGQTALMEAFNFYKAIKHHLTLCGNPLQKDSAVLDFGCGWGRYSRYFLKDIDSKNLFGIDVDPMFVDVCKQTFPVGNFLTVPSAPPSGLPSGKFHLILAYSVFSHLAPAVADQWIEEFARLLAPGGLLVVTTQGRSFINFCAEIRKSGNASSLWHQKLATSFTDEQACFEAYDRGEFLFAATGAGEVRPATFYGEALVPRGYVERVWSKHLELKAFIDDRSYLPQALIVMQKKS